MEILINGNVVVGTLEDIRKILGIKTIEIKEKNKDEFNIMLCSTSIHTK